MPASLRAHLSRTTSSRPYDRRSPTASPVQSESPLVHPYLLPASPTQEPEPDTPPDHPGLPTYADYKRIEAGYLHSLSPRKRDKALITQAMFDKIWDVLHQPDACTIETPQFRFWVRKMFTLSRPMCVDGGWGGEPAGGAGTHLDPDSDAEEQDLELERAMGIGMGRGAGADGPSDLFTAVVLHENRPVAIMEQLYELFCYCHVRAGHGGRDKTCAVIRRHYSWVPKELTAQFVKACPTCVLKRNGHGGGVGVVDTGMTVQRRVVGQRGRKVRGAHTRAEETPLLVVPSSLGSVGWPTTGGPLDPANPEPCGVRERGWLHAREDARTTGPSNPVSPARASVDTSGSKTRSVSRKVPLESCLPGGWDSIPQASIVNASPFHQCDTTRWLETTGFSSPFAVENSKGRSGGEEKRSPTRTGLPPLASALSDESLDKNVNLTGLGPETVSGDPGECLPHALRPLRLLGPIPSESESDPLSSHIFQIDPVLLSFSYPGMSLGPSEFNFASSGTEGDGMPLALPRAVAAEVQRHREMSNVAGLSGYPTHLHGEDIDMELSMPALETSERSAARSESESDSPDSSFECADSRLRYPTGGGVTLPFSFTSTDMARSQCGSRYGYRDDPLPMLYHCSADEVGQELDGTFPFFHHDGPMIDSHTARR